MATSVYFRVQDAKGDTAVREIYIPEAVTATNAVAFAKSIAPLISQLMGGGVVGLGVSFEIDPSSVAGVSQAIGSTSDLQEMAYFAFRDAKNFIKGLTLPTILESKFLSGSKTINTADADVAAFVTAMTGGLDVTAQGGTGTISPSSLHDDDLTDLVEAREAWGKYRK